jgi:hypothetical protein
MRSLIRIAFSVVVYRFSTGLSSLLTLLRILLYMVSTCIGSISGCVTMTG